jgi:hypothetical protein
MQQRNLRILRGYIVSLFLIPGLLDAQTVASGIGYASVSAARKALGNKPTVQTVERAGWTIVTDAQGNDFTTWTFAPRAHAAYPSVVRRDIVLKNNNPTLVTRVLCEAQRAACDTLYSRLQTRIARCTSDCTTVLP